MPLYSFIIVCVVPNASHSAKPYKPPEMCVATRFQVRSRLIFQVLDRLITPWGERFVAADANDNQMNTTWNYGFAELLILKFLQLAYFFNLHSLVRTKSAIEESGFSSFVCISPTTWGLQVTWEIPIQWWALNLVMPPLVKFLLKIHMLFSFI